MQERWKQWLFWSLMAEWSVPIFLGFLKSKSAPPGQAGNWRWVFGDA